MLRELHINKNFLDEARKQVNLALKIYIRECITTKMLHFCFHGLSYSFLKSYLISDIIKDGNNVSLEYFYQLGLIHN